MENLLPTGQLMVLPLATNDGFWLALSEQSKPSITPNLLPNQARSDSVYIELLKNLRLSVPELA